MHLGFSQIHLLHKLKALANKQQTPFSLTHILKVLKEQNPGTVKVNYGDTSPDSPAKSRYSTGSPSCVNFFISNDESPLPATAYYSLISKPAIRYIYNKIRYSCLRHHVVQSDTKV